MQHTRSSFAAAVALLAVLTVGACTGTGSPDVPPTTTSPTATPTTSAPTSTPTTAPSTTPTAAPTTTPAPNTDKYAGCVAPAGMTALIDQDKSDSQKPWKMPAGANHVEVWFSAQAKDGFNDAWWSYVDHGATVWNKSPCLDVRVVRGPCPTGKNCVPMVVGDGGGDDGNFNATEKGGFTTKGDIQLSKKLSAKTDKNGCNEQKNVTAHEMGHAVGLVHRNKRVLMNGDTYGDICEADADEYKNLLFDYGRQVGKSSPAPLFDSPETTTRHK